MYILWIVYLFLNLKRRKKMMVNPLPKDRILRPKNGRYAAVVNTLFPKLNVEDESTLQEFLQ